MRTSIDRMPSGRYRVRIADPLTGKLKPLKAGLTFADRDEAVRVRDEAVELLRAEGIESGPLNLSGATLRTLGKAFFQRRKTKRNLRTEFGNWKRHVLKHAIADVPVDRLTRPDLRAFLLVLEQTKAVRVHRDGRVVETGQPLNPRTVRAIFQLVAQVLDDAVELEIVERNVAREIKLPETKRKKARGYLYPSEDRALMGAHEEQVPLVYRMLYGLIAREGMRPGEALALDWADLDLERGILRLDANKTDDPRAWALDPGVLRALAWWKAKREPAAGDPVFEGRRGRFRSLRADTFRGHLQAAGIGRVDLFERTSKREHIWAHDLRGTFVTLSLAAGKTETWVQDRTGHTTNAMLARYRRLARTAREVGLGALQPLDEAIPEIRSAGGPMGSPVPVTESEIVAVSAAMEGFVNRRSPVRVRKVAPDIPGEFGRPASRRGPIVGSARAYVRAVEERDPSSVELAVALGKVAIELGGELARLGQRIAAGGPHLHRRAIELLELLAGELATLELSAADDDEAAHG